MYPAYIGEIIGRFEKNGEKAYIVGGSLRDILIGIPPHDYDIATSALPEVTARIFSDKHVIETGIKHGTVTVVWDGEPVEITTFRIDGSYTDSRHPDSVSFTSDIVADLSRRDFTVNAMAYSQRDGLVDPFGGREDIERRTIRAVREPSERFREDALRIMRAFRFSAQLGFDIEARTLDGISETKGGLEYIARERVGNEFLKLITCPSPQNSINLMIETGVVEYVLGDYLPSDRVVSQIEKMPNDIPSRLGFLLCEADEEKARYILHSLRCSNKQITGAMAVARGSVRCVSDSADARRLIADTGVYALSAARASELCGNSGEGAYELTQKQADTPCSLKELKINGKTLAEMGVKGKAIGEILDRLMSAVIDDPTKNDSELLKEMAIGIIDERKGK